MFLKRRQAPLIFGSVSIVALVGVLALYRSSPGPLTADHAPVAGSNLITDCNKCHAPEGLDAGCLACHKEIKKQLNSPKGFHAYLGRTAPGGCAGCHSEHNGGEFKLLGAAAWAKVGREKFAHAHTEFRLTGKHAGLACEKCHGKTLPFALPDFPNIQRRETYLGLGQKCGACHKDPHLNGAAPDCADCHTQTAWKPTPNFNHDKFFPLRNGHAKISCQKCHPAPRSLADPMKKGWKPFSGALGKKCEECHKSPHRTKWKEGCLSCHDADARSWTTAARRMTPAIHAATGFPLVAPHQRAACEKCHAGASYAAKFPDPSAPGYPRRPASCEGCHRDEHRGQFKGKYPRCAQCHGPTAFKPVRFTAKNHTVWPLSGKHEAGPCAKCHLADRLMGTRKFVGTPRDCAGCHKDIHHGQFLEKGVTRCETCHASTLSWKKTLFNHNKQSAFPLDKAHAPVACDQCHPKARAPDGSVVTLYKPIARACKDCHDMP